MIVKICFHGSQGERLYLYMGHVLKMFKTHQRMSLLLDLKQISSSILVLLHLFIQSRPEFSIQYF